MRTVDLIHRKRDGEELSAEEIAYLVDGYTDGTIPDYQASAFLMAVFFSGMTDREVSTLTERMVLSGENGGSFLGSGRQGGQTLHRRRGRQDQLDSIASGGGGGRGGAHDLGPRAGPHRRHAR